MPFHYPSLCFCFLDAFLHQIHSATEKLKNMSLRVNQLMSEKVNGMISTIEEFCLYDMDMAFSRTWVSDTLHFVTC